MNQAIPASPVAPAIADVAARVDPGAQSIFGAHRGPLTVTDNFDVLDDPVEQQDFTTFPDADDPAGAESVLMVQGMYCAACADTVESALQGLPGVQSALVHAATRRLTVRWDTSLTRMSHLARVVGKPATVCCRWRRLCRSASAFWRPVRHCGACLWRVFAPCR